MAKHALKVEQAGEGQPAEVAIISGADAAASGFDPASLRFVTRRVSATERAAVTAVLGSVLEQESAMLGQAPGSGTSAWERSQRPMREPLIPGHHRWNKASL